MSSAGKGVPSSSGYSARMSDGWKNLTRQHGCAWLSYCRQGSDAPPNLATADEELPKVRAGRVNVQAAAGAGRLQSTQRRSEQHQRRGRDGGTTPTRAPGRERET
jgi:hypothetical protein